MDAIEKRVRQARRRLSIERFVRLLGWWWTAALGAALVWIGLARLWPLGPSDWISVVGALAAGTLGCLAWTVAARPRLIDAAVEIDRRSGLKERVSSAVAMGVEDRASEAGQALAADAAARLNRVDLGEKFPVRLSRHILLPLFPAVAAALVAILFPPAVSNTPAEALAPEAQPQPEVKASTEILRRQLEDHRRQAEKQGLQDATELLKKLEEGTREIQAEPRREKALVKLNDLARQLQDRRKELGGAEKMKQQLDELNRVDRGPAQKFAQALARGDFKKAAEQLEKLRKEATQGQLDEAKKAELAKQFDEMRQKLDQLADASRAARADLQKRAEQLRQAGQPADADKLEDQINKLMEQAPQLQQVQDLANKLGQCSQCLKSGKSGEAAQAMQDAMQQLDKLQAQMDELQTLDQALDQLTMARQRMTCPNCQGAGCEMCQGEGGQGLCAGNGSGKDGKPGDGMGGGKGIGYRPEQKTDTALYDSQVRQKVGKGAAMVTGMVDGPNVPGGVTAEIQRASDDLRRGSVDPLTGRQLPKKHSEHAREYFDRFREGK